MRFHLHVRRRVRDLANLDADLFSTNGRVIFADFLAARRLAAALQDTGTELSPAELNAIGLIHEILHGTINRYRREVNPTVILDALADLDAQIGAEAVDATLEAFLEEFPPPAIYRNQVSVQDYLGRSTGGFPNRVIALEELLLVWLANQNPALQNVSDLFSDEDLRLTTAYLPIVERLETFFSGTADPANPVVPSRVSAPKVSLLDLLMEPAREAPDSVFDQLAYVQRSWGLEEDPAFSPFLSKIDLSAGFQQEEERAQVESFLRWKGGTETTEAAVPETGGDGQWGGFGFAEPPTFREPEVYDEPEAYSEDLDWMPNVVMIAKSTLVWLDQLSKRYERPIETLDQIPDEELDQLAEWGITALWLIGIWERSFASKEIKRRRGNPEAESSAYSLDEYRIADRLGGYAAYEDLRDRAKERGVRLASDMVPNHTAIDSIWVKEHPEWFVHSYQPPYPNYQFRSENLSDDPRYGIWLEDHYYDQTDAAVVFKRTDFETGRTHYIYHGNDGTGMPWNDTAQLDYLKAEVREVVTQTILNVAKMFPIIRFDAAMVLVKRHIRRLWYPEPGNSAEAVASRSEFALPKTVFDQLLPEEFWRELVDRVAVEAPDTLLLAEAFWMLEGYFVRTLGMHRVYNSAFMHMMRDEDNAGYRSVMKDTLEFDPEILKRYVNFMNNPDEETAVIQFGKGDKYTGVCLMMLTMPGLPMFGHGQVEGFEEKYGMEYRRAYLDEHPDPYLVARHERELFPIAKRRYLFGEVEHFLLYDFEQAGRVNENVYAFSNEFRGEHSLVFFNNAYERASGRIQTSAAYAAKQAGSETKTLTRKSIGDGLGLTSAPDRFVIYRDAIAGLEYLRRSQDIARHGFHQDLNGYGYRVYLDIRDVEDDQAGTLAQLAAQLHGRGVPDVEEAKRGHLLRPLHEAYAAALRVTLQPSENDARQDVYFSFLKHAADQAGFTADEEGLGGLSALLTDAVLALEALSSETPEEESAGTRSKKGKAFPATLKPKDADLLDAALAEDAPRIALLAATLAAPVEAFMESATGDVQDDSVAEETEGLGGLGAQVQRGLGSEDQRDLGARGQRIEDVEEENAQSETDRETAANGIKTTDPQSLSPSAPQPLQPSAYAVFDLARVVQDEAREAQTAGGDAYEA
ncbi:MAG: alpha-amylase family glycosyl hydrolase, partial [Bacteroidota bacterium]